jgi:hypothetical protein
MLLKSADEYVLTARYMCLRREASDAGRLPLIRSYVELPPGEGKHILRRLGELKIPACPDFSSHSNEDFTELEIGGYWGRVHYRWSSNAPPGWAELDALVREIIHRAGVESLPDPSEVSDVPPEPPAGYVSGPALHRLKPSRRDARAEPADAPRPFPAAP